MTAFPAIDFHFLDIFNVLLVFGAGDDSSRPRDDGDETFTSGERMCVRSR